MKPDLSPIIKIANPGALNGKRNIDRAMDYHLSRPDVEHPLLSIECKYRAKISGFLKDGIRQAMKYDPDKIPVLVLKERNMRGELVVIRLSDFQDLFGNVKQTNDGYNAVTASLQDKE